MWSEPLAVLAVIGIVYGALVALSQKDFKFVIGYSSVSHMGFVLLGLVTYNEIGVTGAVMQMFSHGVIAGLLFGVVGRMVYDRTHTRDFELLEPMALSRQLPFAAVIFAVATMASMGMPGFSGFVAELQVLVGAWHAFPTLGVLSGIGIVIGVAYALRALQKAFFNDSPALVPDDTHHSLEPISVAERFGAFLLIGATIITGLFPKLLLDLIVPSFNSPLFEGLRKGGLL